jgi:Ca2+/H+ antiporter
MKTWPLLSFHGPQDEDTEAVVVSLSLSVIALIVYILLLWFKLGTHRHIHDYLSLGPVRENQLSGAAPFATLVLLAFLVSLSTKYMISAYKCLAQGELFPRHIQSFLGFPLLRVLGADHMLAIRSAMRNRLDLVSRETSLDVLRMKLIH